MRLHTRVYGHRNRVCTEKLTLGEKSLAAPGNRTCLNGVLVRCSTNWATSPSTTWIFAWGPIKSFLVLKQLDVRLLANDSHAQILKFSSNSKHDSQICIPQAVTIICIIFKGWNAIFTDWNSFRGNSLSGTWMTRPNYKHISENEVETDVKIPSNGNQG